jgi:hypothetical protein
MLNSFRSDDMTKMKKYYGVLISTDPNRGYQFYVGWDQIFSDRSEAEKLLKQARATFCGAKLTTATAEEAIRWGWMGA